MQDVYKTAQVDATQDQGPQSVCAWRAHGLYPRVTPLLPKLMGSVDGHRPISHSQALKVLEAEIQERSRETQET